MAAVPDDPVYAAWIRMFGDADYDALVTETTGLRDRLADPADAAQWARLSAVFSISIRYEGDFWDMAARGCLTGGRKEKEGPMRAIQVQDDLTLCGSDIDTPQPGHGEVLVRVHAAGVCGTDLHIMDGMIKPDAYPMTLGHEAAGVALVAGTRVAVFNKLFCGTCEQCLLGRQNLCTVERRMGELLLGGPRYGRDKTPTDPDPGNAFRAARST